ncbi:CapA family protein [Streptomyces sp. 549]|uniref:CapA family protein n=1 Tax=Streptomyces sp. 549 TaxID=3049076 RepID=UPI0024C2C492|nr:CapA family protein [Streptomyces sp. 549]MDK1474171.1 CapA family protein [Streptomyces sp. 549]
MAQHTRLAAALLATVALLGPLAACGTAAPGAPAAPAAGQGSPLPGAPAEAPAGGPPPTRGFTLVATGDILPHDSIIQQAWEDADGTGHDFGPLLAGARHVVADADLAICHMETVYGADGGPFTGYPTFRTPPQIARAIKDTGYHSCSTASNHTLDAGAAGVTRTLDAMDRVGLRHAGSARSATERDTPVILPAGDARVAHLAYTYGTNGNKVPAGQPWLVNLMDPARIVADARAARRSGADVVVVSMHWGTEWQEEPDSRQLSLARRLTASNESGRRDIDLIIGTHAHVPQPYEKVNGTWVVYGMGDQVAGVMKDPRGSMGSAARFRFTPPAARGGTWRVESAEFVPHLMASSPRFELVNLPRALAAEPDRAEFRDARDLVRGAALSRGAAEHGLTMGR